MPKTSSIMGMILVRKTYARQGRPYAVLTIPAAVVEALDLRPGDQLLYTVNDNRLIFQVAADAMGKLPGFDKDSLPPRVSREQWEEGRKGSMWAAADQVDRVMREAAHSLTQKDPSKFDPGLRHGGISDEEYEKAKPTAADRARYQAKQAELKPKRRRR